MESDSAKTDTKPEIKKTRRVFLKKVDQESAKVMAQIKERINKKPFGRKIRDSEIIAVAIKLVGPEEVAALQESTYSDKDRFNIYYESYQKSHGKLPLDEFLKKLMRGELNPQN